MREQFHSLLDLLQGAARYRWHAVATAWLICVAGWVVLMSLPSKFEARARVFVDTSTALSPMMQGLAIQQDITAQLNLMQEALEGDAQLDRVIDSTSLAAKATDDRARGELKKRLRDDIVVSVDLANSRGPGGLVYLLRYWDTDRGRGLDVVQMLLDSLVKGTLGGSIESSEAAQQFVVERIHEYEQRLTEAEKRLADFKKKNIGIMPGAEGDYFTRLQNEIDAARKTRELLSVALSKRDELSRQLKDGNILASAASAGPVPTITLPSGQRTSGGDTLSQLADAQAKLDALLRTYTERHPDVGTLRQQIEELKLRRARELAALRLGDDEAVLSSGVTANPVYQSVRLALNEAEVDVASLRRELAGHEAKVAELRQRVNSMPEVEAELSRLNRDYDMTKVQYLGLVERLEKAKLGQTAERSDSGVRFDILDAPQASYRPVSPPRPMLVAAIFVASIAGGVGLAILLHLLRPVFNHLRELERETGLPVLGAVSLMGLEEYCERARRSYLCVAGATAALFLAFVAVLLLSLGVGNPFA
jgi:polysaccharide chain length determinant protein (PEP-CTERM system associated)